MRKLSVAMLAIGATLALAGCVASPELPSLGLDGAVEDAEYPEWLDDSVSLPSIGLTLLGEEGDMTAYASRDEDDNWCVIAIDAPSATGNGDDWGASSSCVPPATFASNGAMVSYSGGGRSGGAHFLPPGYHEQLEAGWVRVSPQLAVKR